MFKNKTDYVLMIKEKRYFIIISALILIIIFLLFNQSKSTVYSASDKTIARDQQPKKSKKIFTDEQVSALRNKASGYGMSPEWLLTIIAVADDVGVDENHLYSMLFSMIRNIEAASADQFSHEGRAIANIGLTGFELSAMNPDEQFFALSTAFKTYPRANSKFVLATNIFGILVTPECVTLLNQGGDKFREKRKQLEQAGILPLDGISK